MSVIITNVTEARELGTYGKGKQRYVLRINNKVIAEFDHDYEDGLAKCLERAAKATRKAERIDKLVALADSLAALKRTNT